MSVLVELGGGTKPHPAVTYGLDWNHPVDAPAQDITMTPWLVYDPIDRRPGEMSDESVDEVFASHVMEHVPKGHATLAVMNEAWRVLRPGGRFVIICPLIGYTDGSGGHLVNRWEPYADPTHVQGWWFPESLLYFTEGGITPDADYGIKRWAPLAGDHWQVRDGWEGIAWLTKP